MWEGRRPRSHVRKFSLYISNFWTRPCGFKDLGIGISNRPLKTQGEHMTIWLANARTHWAVNCKAYGYTFKGINLKPGQKRSLNKTERDISSISVLAEGYTAKKMIGLLLKDSQSSRSLLPLAGNHTLSVSDLHRIRFALITCRSLLELHCKSIISTQWRVFFFQFLILFKHVDPTQTHS